MWKNKLKTKNHKLQTESGVSLYLAFMILALVLGIALGGSALLLQQIQSQRQLGYSVFAFGAADAGIEQIFYDDQSGVDVLAQCPDIGGAPPPDCTGNLTNEATYVITVTPPGSGCPAVEYCAKSVGSYQGFQRAIRIAR